MYHEFFNHYPINRHLSLLFFSPHNVARKFLHMSLHPEVFLKNKFLQAINLDWMIYVFKGLIDRSRILQGRGIKWTSGLELPFHSQIAQASFPIPFISANRDLHEWLLSSDLLSTGSVGVYSCSRHWGLGDWEIYYSLAVAGGKRYVAKCCSQEVKENLSIHLQMPK